MTDTEYSLWQLLMLTNGTEKPVELSCSDCFTLLDYDAGLLTNGGDLGDLMPVIKHHLSICASCQAELKSWLNELNEDGKPLSKSNPLRGKVIKNGNSKSGN